ncbi:5-carboxymethyl-2-hydroxymuconate Delta-isomerase [Chryseobacterium sp. SIMBA_029]|uniref:5-carboxymethyl-2-hydroxymuconate Delta-isomerase n=1 Tax=Chryseobacterium sp. SIMBA_029 TaxID=3085772 RepID=UPI00397B5199
MPHFIIECSKNILQQRTPEEIMNVVYETADSSGIFALNDIKVRLHPYEYYRLGDQKDSFLHIFGYIMEGRSTEQKAVLSKQICTNVTALFPDISFLAVSIHELEAATYCNKALINPENSGYNRHFGL